MKHSRIYLSALLGTSLEYYDYKLFVFLAPILSQLFFPHDSFTNGLIKTYGITFLGTLARPIGAYAFGYVGDKYGRRTALSYSIGFMALSSLLMALMPTYAQIGIMAPILIMLCRLLQSASAGGELNGSAIFMIEHVGQRHAGLASGIMIGFTIVGILLAALTSTLCMGSSQPTFYWRFAFLAGLLIGVVGFFIRRYTYESADYLACKKSIKDDHKTLLLSHRSLYLRCFCIFAMSSAFVSIYYFSFVFLKDYIPLKRGLDFYHSTQNITVLLLVFLGAAISSGFISDKIGQRHLMGGACALMLLVAAPLMSVINHAPLDQIFYAQLVFAMIAGVFIGPAHAFYIKLFPASYRYQCISFFYSLGSSIFGASTPIVCIKLWQHTSMTQLPVLWIMFTAMLGLLGVLLTPTQKAMHAAQPSAVTIG